VRRGPKTHLETEIKLLVKDLPALLERLRALGIKPRGRVLERNTLFDTDDGDLRRRGRLLRLRTEAPAPAAFASGGPKRTILTAKSPTGPRKSGKSRKANRYKETFEREVTLRDSFRRSRRGKRTLRDRGWPFALGVLGLRAKFRYEKYRTTFRARSVHVDLDETTVGVFLELEGAAEAIDRMARDLGFTPKDYIRATYYDFYAAECRRKGRPVRNMLFSR
jgi:adenylate cyclase class IV